ncbi:hypothetical protein MNBD_BACTEROID01-2526 [hydrothermal vent metagenome]|uniref:Uncharacterized protein n=1 Tax=hydrothermal vent metagenome TaxID=652676 RepID=A0A3B0TXT6_9ZZZZ
MRNAGLLLLFALFIITVIPHSSKFNIIIFDTHPNYTDPVDFGKAFFRGVCKPLESQN